MKKIMNLNQFQKLLLIVIMGSVLFTGLIYCTLNSKIGFEYQKQIFIPESQNDCTVYSGILNGKQTRFIVFDNQVVFEYGHDQVNTYTVYKDDSIEAHMEDTLKGGSYLNDKKLVEILVNESPKRLIDLENYGALFDRQESGQINQRPFGGQTYRRTCYQGDRTGAELLNALKEEIIKRDIE